MSDETPTTAQRRPGALKRSERSQTLTVAIPSELARQLQAATRREDLSQSQIVRRAIRSYLDGPTAAAS
jgi:metal-responsive CopG/Arc/MetJ family transcriptional regulator